MGNFPHRIRRQRWTLRTYSAAAAFSLRRRLRDDWQEVLLPAFEAVFDQEAPGTRVVQIPRLELTFKITPEETAGPFWSSLLREQLVGQLREALRGQRQVREKPRPWKRSTARQDSWRTLRHYLQTGSINWERARLSSTEVAAELQKTCRLRWRGVARLVRGAPPPSFAFCFRLLQLVPATEVTELVPLIVAEISAPRRGLVLEMLVALLSNDQKYFARHTQLQVAALLLSEAFSANEAPTVFGLIDTVRRALPLENEAVAAFLASLPAAVRGAVDRESISREQPASAKNEAAKIPTGRPVRHARRSERASGGICAVIPPEKEGLEEIFCETTSSTRAALDDSDFPLLASHAGLILLHPFLPRLFESTGLKEKNGARLSPAALPRAAALLHFLAKGPDAIYEYDLVFIKVLLGLEPERPLCVSEGLIAETDIQEAEVLLQSAITHWSALKKTSVANFRRSFLDRKALLRKEENSWRLQVEREPFDVLIEHLPWGLGVVKLPWMPRPLFVEW